MANVKKYLLMLLLTVLSASAQAVVLKADIGVCACWDSVSLNVYQLCGLKVGTFGIIANTTCLLLQLAVLGRQFSPRRLLQLPASLIYGTTTNLVYYNMLTFEINSYAARVAILVLGFLALAITTGTQAFIDVAPTPPEGLCRVLSRKTGRPFGLYRTGIDVVCIAVSLALSAAFGLSLKVREGTVIGMFLMGPVMNAVITREERMIRRPQRATA